MKPAHFMDRYAYRLLCWHPWNQHQHQAWSLEPGAGGLEAGEAGEGGHPPRAPFDL
jgi:hypothetical protein